MRFSGIGLLALLVVVAIILVMYAQFTVPTVQKSQDARNQVEQIAGVDASGGRVTDTYDLKTELDAGKLRGLRVTRITPSSPMASYYGLQKDDLIIEYGAAGSMMKVREENDAELARSMIAQAYQTKQPLIVMRNGAPVTLDGTANKSPASPTGTGTGDSVQDQLNKIKTPR